MLLYKVFQDEENSSERWTNGRKLRNRAAQFFHERGQFKEFMEVMFTHSMATPGDKFSVKTLIELFSMPEYYDDFQAISKRNEQKVKFD